jgi:hypothetical protein
VLKQILDVPDDIPHDLLAEGDRTILTPHHNHSNRWRFSDFCTVSGLKRCTTIPSIWETDNA